MSNLTISKSNTLQIDDVLIAISGDKIVNIDFYAVTKVIGQKGVVVIKLGKDCIDSNLHDTALCTPDITRVTSKPMVRPTVDGKVKISNSVRASKMEYTEIFGSRIYDSYFYSKAA